MLIMLILLIWWLFLCSFASNMTFNCSDSKFLHSSTSTGTKSQSGRHQNSLVLFCYPNWQWVSSTVDWIPLCHGWKCLPSTAGKGKKKKEKGTRETLLVYLKVKIVLALTIRTTHPPSWPLCMYLWGAYMKQRRLIQMILLRLLLFYERLFFFRGLLGCWTTVRIQEFGSVLVLVSWSFLK